MSFAVEQSVVIKRSLIPIWHFWIDLPQWPRWHTGLLDAYWLTSELWWKKGSQFVLVWQGKFPLNRYKVRCTVTSVEPGKSITWRAKGIGLKAMRGYRFSEVSGGTQVTAYGKFNGPAAVLLRPLARAHIKMRLTQALAGLAKMVEQEVLVGKPKVERVEVPPEWLVTGKKYLPF